MPCTHRECAARVYWLCERDQNAELSPASWRTIKSWKHISEVSIPLPRDLHVAINSCSGYLLVAHSRLELSQLFFVSFYSYHLRGTSSGKLASCPPTRLALWPVVCGNVEVSSLHRKGFTQANAICHSRWQRIGCNLQLQLGQTRNQKAVQVEVDSRARGRTALLLWRSVYLNLNLWFHLPAEWVRESGRARGRERERESACKIDSCR